MVPSASALPRYWEQRYWDDRYAAASALTSNTQTSKDSIAPPTTEWYAGCEALPQLCDPAGPLGAAALVPPGRLLELGCGDSEVVFGLASMGFAVLGLDFAPSALQRAAQQFQGARLPGPGSFDLAVSDVRALPVASGSFDAVLDKGCFDALRSKDCAAFLQEVCRVLRPGGSFVCISNSDALVRSHAGKVANWTTVPGAPFLLAGVDDEIFVHSYVVHAGVGNTNKACRFSTSSSHSEVGCALTRLHSKLEADVCGGSSKSGI